MITAALGVIVPVVVALVVLGVRVTLSTASPVASPVAVTWEVVVAMLLALGVEAVQPTRNSGVKRMKAVNFIRSLYARMTKES